MADAFSLMISIYSSRVDRNFTGKVHVDHNRKSKMYELCTILGNVPCFVFFFEEKTSITYYKLLFIHIRLFVRKIKESSHFSM